MKFSLLTKKKNHMSVFGGLQNVTIDLCQYFGNGGLTSMIMDIFFADLKAHSNLFHPCPFEVNISIVKFSN